MKLTTAFVLFCAIFAGSVRAEDQTGCVAYPKPQCKSDEQEMVETDPMGCAMPICYKAKATKTPVNDVVAKTHSKKTKPKAKKQ